MTEGDKVRDPAALRERAERRGPTRLGAFDWVGVLVRSGLTYKVVPEEFWTLTTEDDVSVALVACPCGKSAHVELAEFPEPCECGRWFFFAGTEVWAFLSPT